MLKHGSVKCAVINTGSRSLEQHFLPHRQLRQVQEDRKIEHTRNQDRKEERESRRAGIQEGRRSKNRTKKEKRKDTRNKGGRRQI